MDEKITVTAEGRQHYYINPYDNDTCGESKVFYLEDFDSKGACLMAANAFFVEQCNEMGRFCSQDACTGEVTLTCSWDSFENEFEQYP